MCVWLIDRLHRRGASEFKIVSAGFGLGALTFLLQFYIVPQVHMLDFTNAYYKAGALAPGDSAGFQELLAKGATGFVNLPIVAFIFTPFSLLSVSVALVIFFCIGMLASIWVWRQLVRYVDLDAKQSALLAFLMIGSGPAAYGMIIGNTSQIVMCAVLWGTALMVRGKDWQAGMLFAAAAFVKPALLLLGAYALLRGRWRVSLAGGIACGLAIVLSIAIFGWSLHLVWLEKTILPALQGLILAHNVQSIGAVIGRLFYGDLYLNNWDIHPISPAIAIVVKVGQLVVLGLIVGSIVMLVRKAQPRKTIALEISFVLFAVMLLPNISWNHYYIWALLPFTLLLHSTFPLSRNSPEMWLLLLAGCLIAQPVVFWHGGVDWINGVFARLIVSLPFVGLALLMAISVRRVLLWEQLAYSGWFTFDDGHAPGAAETSSALNVEPAKSVTPRNKSKPREKSLLSDDIGTCV